MKVYTLNDGGSLPAIGFGTWKIKPEEAQAAVVKAIELGYRHIDCAAASGNEKEVGCGLSQCFDAGRVKREDLFITSKLWNTDHAPHDVLPALKKTLKDLNLEYLDLYVIHWPVALTKESESPPKADQLIAPNKLPISATWSAMEQAVDLDLVRSIGVSNFSARKLQELIDSPNTRIPPAVNQIERHPYLQVRSLLDYCSNNNIHVTAFSPLGSSDRPHFLKEAEEPSVLKDPIVRDIAIRHCVSPAQVLIGWAVQSGTSVLVKSIHPRRKAENLASIDAVTLDDIDLGKIADLDKNRRYISGDCWCIEGGPYTQSTLWDE